MAAADNRPTYTTDAIPSDIKNSLFLGNPALDNLMSCVIAMGAEVLIPGCGLMAPCLRFAPGCESEYPQGLTHVDGVPIVDIYGATVRAAETLVAFKRARSPWVSRACQFAKPSPEALEGGKSILEYAGPGFWDC